MLQRSLLAVLCFFALSPWTAAQTTQNANEGSLKLTVSPDIVRYHFDGFGGNYCFGIESPVTLYTLANLKQAWCRTQMTLTEWEPQNDNDDPADTKWAALEATDKPGSNLRREFAMAKQIQDMGMRYVISIWRLPEWMYTNPGAATRPEHRRINPAKWHEVVESITSYLLYAKRAYGVEPDLLSFNEPDYGVYVQFTPEEHRDLIKELGARFAATGLKTRLLLGDTFIPRDTHKFCLPAADDPEAMKYVGAISFHSWGGAAPAQYAAWADLAKRLRLPLLVAELGVDAGAWRQKGIFDTYEYALREMQHYQELLLYARPQGTMQWQFTNDYETVKVSKDAGGLITFTPNCRFAVVRHFCNLTPRDSEALGVSSEDQRVLVTAFRGSGGTYAVHIVNTGPARPATLSGLPLKLGSLQAIQTTKDRQFEELPGIKVAPEVKLSLASNSLLTLTGTIAKPASHAATGEAKK